MFQMWERFKPVYGFKGYSGDCGECILGWEWIQERGVGGESQNLDESWWWWWWQWWWCCWWFRKGPEEDPGRLADKLGIRVGRGGGWREEVRTLPMDWIKQLDGCWCHYGSGENKERNKHLKEWRKSESHFRPIGCLRHQKVLKDRYWTGSWISSLEIRAILKASDKN